VAINLLEIAFWLCAACVLYAYVGYAGILALSARLSRRRLRPQAGFTATVSFVVAAHNEEMRIGPRIAELRQLLESSGVQGEIIVISDGSTDATAEKARALNSGAVVLELPQRVGKGAALSAGWMAARHDILVFADTRQRWDGDALKVLLKSFADPTIGAVSGDLVLEAQPGMMAGIGLYWRYEKWLRQQESRIHSTVGVTGAICAVRRQLFLGVPPNTILDDLYWPLLVTMQGYRVIHEKRAVAYDCLPERAYDEFRRKVRTLAGNFQLVARLPQLLLPWRNPVWLPFVSHKLLRLVVPWALLGMLLLSAVMKAPLYEWLLWGQIGFYGLALLGIVRAVGSQLRPAGGAASVLVLNAAAWLAFWVWISGWAEKSWSKVSYKPAVLGFSIHSGSPAPSPTAGNRARAVTGNVASHKR
jgi:cellulose synthase/poly-beta-1,6-N-acetylglucosamine synthase-like glycosyltransferase